MSRVEQSNSEVLEKKLDRLEKQMRSSNRRILSCSNCLMFFLILIVVGFIWVSSVLAKTGLVDVWYFSNKYEAPEPTVVVQSEPLTTESITTQLQKQVGAEIATLTFTNEQLTGLMTNLVRKPLTDEAVAYVVTRNSVVDIFIHDGKTVIQILATVSGEGGRLQFDVTSFKLGQLSLPPVAAGIILNSVIGGSFSTVEKVVQSWGDVKSVTVNDAGVIISVVLKKKSGFFDVF